MGFNPVETSLYVTLSALTQCGALPLYKDTHQQPMSTRKLNQSFQQYDDFRKKEILSFTAPPSTLEPYQQIIYKFSERLEDQFLTSPVSATEILHDTLSMNPSSNTMVALHTEHIGFLSYMDDFLAHCERNNVHNATAQTYLWRQKLPLISNLFRDAKPSITGSEYTEMLDMARMADELKNNFTRVNSIYLPK